MWNTSFILVISLFLHQFYKFGKLEEFTENGKDINTKIESNEPQISIRIPVPIDIISLSDSFEIMGYKKDQVDIANNTQTVAAFLGIPYAEPFVTNLRFQPPQLHIPQKSINAKLDPTPCPQIAPNGEYSGSEDCLYLSVFVPLLNGTIPESSLPVLVWFHGESFSYTESGKLSVLSSGSAKELDPTHFLFQNIIVVTPQYRLGSLGFLNVGKEFINGNMGLQDQLLALEWTQNFISSFGGDPNRVTAMGHGSSAMTLGILATTSRGLFHRLILMGGSPLSPLAIDVTPQSTFAEIAKLHSCPSFPSPLLIRCLLGKSPEAIVRADFENKIGKNLGMIRIPLPVLQRKTRNAFYPTVLSRAPMDAFKAGDFAQVPLIIGVTTSEMSRFLNNIAGKSGKESLSDILSSHATLQNFIRTIQLRGKPYPNVMTEIVAFEYFGGLNFSDPGKIDQTTDLMEELLSDLFFNIPALQLASIWSRFASVYFYAFDYVHVPDNIEDTAELQQVFPQRASHGTDLRYLMSEKSMSSQDRFEEEMINLWISFMSDSNLFDWPPFKETSKEVLLIGSTVETITSFRGRQEILWTSLLRSLRKANCDIGMQPSSGEPYVSDPYPSSY